jgi:hypothetical protein
MICALVEAGNLRHAEESQAWNRVSVDGGSVGCSEVLAVD